MAPVFSTMFSGPISAERIVLTGIVTLASGIQLIFFARRVFFAREKYDVQFPAVTGSPEFERTYRAQQNVLEWHPVFTTVLWTSALFFHQVPSAVCGVLYIISRQRYFNGYSRSVEERLPGFYKGMRVLGVMSIMAAVGLGRTLVKMVMHHHASHGGWEGMPRPWESVN